MKRRYAVLLVVATLLLACLPGSSFAADIDWTKHRGTTITVAAWTRPIVDALREMTPQFEAQTGIKVRWLVMDAWELRAKVMREFALGTPTIDAWFYHPSQQEMAIQLGNYQVDQAAYISDRTTTSPSFDFDDVLPVAQLGGRVFWPGGSYSIVVESQPTGLWYRKDLFQGRGMAVPKTWDELKAAAAKLTLDQNGDGTPEVYGFLARGKGFESITRIGGVLFGHGGAWWTADRKSALAKPETLTAIREYAKALTTYGPRATQELGWLEVARLFADGKGAMLIESGEHLPLFEDPNRSAIAGRVGMAAYPAGPRKQAIITEQLAIGIPSRSPRKEAAWLFAQWAASKDVARKLLSNGVAVVRRSALSDLSVQVLNKEWKDYVLKSLEVGSDYYVNLACVPLTEVRTLWGDVIDAAIAGQAGLESLARQKAQEVDNIISTAEQGVRVQVDSQFVYPAGR